MRDAAPPRPQIASRAPWTCGRGSGCASASRTKRRPSAAIFSSSTRTSPVRWRAKNPTRSRPATPSVRAVHCASSAAAAPSIWPRRAAPTPANRARVPTWNSMSARTEAAASAPGTAQKVRRRAPSTSPHTEATGNSTLMPSRTKRRTRQAPAGREPVRRAAAPGQAADDDRRHPHQDDSGEPEEPDLAEGGGDGGEVVRRHEPRGEAEPHQRPGERQRRSTARPMRARKDRFEATSKGGASSGLTSAGRGRLVHGSGSIAFRR